MDEVIPPNVHRFGQKNHRKIKPGASRRRGWRPYVRRKPLSAPDIQSEGFRSPRNPSDISPQGGRRSCPGRRWASPRGLCEGAHSPAVGQRGNASLAALFSHLYYAVIALTKTIDVERDHLIHRKRSPFPYEGKALTHSILGRVFACRAARGNASLAVSISKERGGCRKSF